MNTNGFNALLRYPNTFHFDLVLYDYAMGPCLLPFLHKFNSPPLVALTAFGHPTYTNALVGDHQYFSYVPHDALSYVGNLDIWHRFSNALIYLYEYWYL